MRAWLVVTWSVMRDRKGEALHSPFALSVRTLSWPTCGRSTYVSDVRSEARRGQVMMRLSRRAHLSALARLHLGQAGAHRAEGGRSSAQWHLTQAGIARRLLAGQA